MSKTVDQLVFTYGTLRKGFGNYQRCLAPFIGDGAEFIDTFETKPEHTMLNLGGYPGVIPFVGNTSIKGELYRITSSDAIRVLNNLESHYGKGNPDNYYDVTEIETNHGPALMYTLSEDYFKYNLRTVESGDWANK